MSRRSIPATKLLLGVVVAALARAAWKEAQRAEAPFPAREPMPREAVPTVETVPRKRTVPKGKLVGALAAVALLAAGMASPAGRSSSLSAPARPAAERAGTLGARAVPRRHFEDLPMHIVEPPRRPVLPAPRPDEQTVALARYADVLGPTGMLDALESEREALAQRVLSDPRVDIYPAGRSDLASGRVDPRVVAVIEYLADTYGEVSVSCLISGHSLYVHQTKRQKKLKLPRVVSAHVYGRAVDISAVAGIPILGHQQPGGITERVVRQLLALPDWIRPRQIISLLDLGGPSFPLPDHANHVHVGY